MEKLDRAIFDNYLEHIAYEFPTMRHTINRLGGRSVGIRLTIEFSFDYMTPNGERFIADAKTVDRQVRILNWALRMDNKKSPPKFVLRDWKIYGGPACAKIVIRLDREQ